MADRVKVKNKNPAPIQITAEQIVREAQERQDPLFKPPEQRIANTVELQEYRQDRRLYLENKVRRNRYNISVYIQYALWEESQGELERARSVYERGLELHYRNDSLWLKYVEMELKHKNVNHCRNLLDRVTFTLPRVNMFWFKYVWMEEMLGNYGRVREVFERWVKWEPEESVWMAYLKFEMRYGELELARKVYERFVGLNPQSRNWIKWARFEEDNGNAAHARAVYEAAVNALEDDELDQNFYISFARFETRQKNVSRARELYEEFLHSKSGKPHQNLLREFNLLEKQYGTAGDVERVVLLRRRQNYEAELAKDPYDYDTWVDFTQLEQAFDQNIEVTRSVYKRAVEQVPLKKEKQFWSRYIYLWLFYALFEETVAGDRARANRVYSEAIQVVPHENFTFAKLWLQYGYFLLRNEDYSGCRTLLDSALETCSKPRLFKGYIELELRLREFDRARALYEQFLESQPSICYAWLHYAQLELLLGDVERCRGIYEIAIDQPVLDEPEELWKAYIDFEIDQGEYSRAFELYEKLLKRTQHVNVWLAFATFAQDSLVVHPADVDAAQAARDVFERAARSMREQCDAMEAEYAAREEDDDEVDLYWDALQKGKQDWIKLLHAWLEFEEENGDVKFIKRVKSMMPKQVKRKRKVYDGYASKVSDEWEEFFDFEFPPT